MTDWKMQPIWKKSEIYIKEWVKDENKEEKIKEWVLKENIIRKEARMTKRKSKSTCR